MNLSIRRAGEHVAGLIAPLLDAYRQFYPQPADLPRARRSQWYSLALAQRSA